MSMQITDLLAFGVKNKASDLKPTQFGQQIIFAHDGENYLTYSSRVWKLDDEGNQVGLDHRETGFWRITGKDEIEVVVAHSTGAVEIFYGNPLKERAWEITSVSTLVTTTEIGRAHV